MPGNPPSRPHEPGQWRDGPLRPRTRASAVGGLLLAAVGAAAASQPWLAGALAATAAAMLLPTRIARWMAAAALAVAMLATFRVAWSRVGGPLGLDYGEPVLLAVSMAAAVPSAWLGPRHLGLALAVGAVGGAWGLNVLLAAGLGLAAVALLLDERA